MDVDELVRSTGPVGPPPSISDLRRTVSRRRARRRTTVGVVVAVALVAVGVAALSGPDRNHDVNVSPTPSTAVGAPSSWEPIGSFDLSGETTVIRIVRGDAGVFVLGDHFVGRVDPDSGDTTDLDLSPGEQSTVVSGVAWLDGLVVAALDGESSSIERWADGAWTTLPLPATRSTWILSTIDDDLVAAGIDFDEQRGEAVETFWRTSDGATWTVMPDPPTRGESPSKLVPIPGGLARTPGWSTALEVWDEATASWVASPATSTSFEPQRTSVWVGDRVVTCGASMQAAHYDCTSWRPGAAGREPVDPPPLPQRHNRDGFGLGLLVASAGGRVVMASGTPDPGTWATLDPGTDQWSSLPPPSGAFVEATEGQIAAVGRGDDVYVAALDGARRIEVARLHLGDGDPVVPRATVLDHGLRVRVPEGWELTQTDEGYGISNVELDRPSENVCATVQVRFQELAPATADLATAPLPFPGTDVIAPYTDRCDPDGQVIVEEDRLISMMVTGAANMPDGDLATILGSFRAARSGGE